MLLGRDRHQTREVFFRAWARHRENLPLEGVEPLIVAVALRHPEYHALLEHPARAEDRDYLPEGGQRTRSCTWVCTSPSRNSSRSTNRAVSARTTSGCSRGWPMNMPCNTILWNA